MGYAVTTCRRYVVFCLRHWLDQRVSPIAECGTQCGCQLNDERRAGQITLHLARVTLGQGYKDGAVLEQLGRAEVIARQYNDEVELGWIWEHMSNVFGFLEDGLDRATELAQSTLEMGERNSDHRLQSVAALRLASFERKRKKYMSARMWLDRAESHAQAIGWLRHLAWISHTRSGILFDEGNYLAAEPLYYQELQLREAWGDRRFIGYIKHHLAQIYAATGRISEARQAAEETRVLLVDWVCPDLCYGLKRCSKIRRTSRGMNCALCSIRRRCMAQFFRGKRSAC